MLLKVEKVQPAKTGKSLRVKANGEWYGAKKDSGIQEGMSIEAEVEDGEFGKWIGKYKQQSNGNGSNGHAGQHSPTTSSPSASGGVAPAWLPFASNTVAHAISAGYIQHPEQVKDWAAAAKAAFSELA